MAMFTYNPYPDSSHEKDRNISEWYAEIDESQGKLMVTYQKTDGEPSKKTKEKYIVDGFEKIEGCKFYKKDSDKEIDITNEEPGLWYSFDYNHGNFHIVPDKSIEIKIGCEGGEKVSLKVSLNEKLKAILDAIRVAVNREQDFVSKVRGGIGAFENCTDNHRYICADVGNNEYLMSFNRLWCAVKDDGTHICNNFGQAQFMCYPKADEEINCLRDGIHIWRKKEITEYKFELMYPKSSDDGGYYYNECDEYNDKAAHLVYNPPYDIKDCAEAIAKGFAEFIKRCENGTFIKSCENGEFFKLCEESKQCEEK